MLSKRPDDQLMFPGPSFDLPNVPLTPRTIAPRSKSDRNHHLPSRPAANLNSTTSTLRRRMHRHPRVSRATKVKRSSWPTRPRCRTSGNMAIFHTTKPTLVNTPQAEYDRSWQTRRSEREAQDSLPADAATLRAVAPSGGRRRNSPLRTLVGVPIGGLAGLALGYYVLLYVLGPRGDFLELAKYLPPVTLPSSFHAAPAVLADAADELPAPPEISAEDTTAGDSANVQATYESSNAPARALTAGGHDRYADDRYGNDQAGVGSGGEEPSRFDEPTAAPLAVDTETTTDAPLRGRHGPHRWCADVYDRSVGSCLDRSPASAVWTCGRRFERRCRAPNQG